MLQIILFKNRFRNTQASPNDWSEVRDILVRSCGSISAPSYLDCTNELFEVRFCGCHAEFLAVKVLAILNEKIRESDFCFIKSFMFETDENEVVKKSS